LKGEFGGKAVSRIQMLHQLPVIQPKDRTEISSEDELRLKLLSTD
jgi:hypothetical protein